MSLFVEGPFDYRRAWEGRVLKVDISTSASAAHVAAMAHNATTAGLYEDLAYCMPRVAVLTLLILVLRAAIMRWVLTPFGNAAVPAKVPPGARYTRADTLERFNNCGWELIFYTFSSLFGLYAYSLESWSVWPSTQIWEGYPLQSMGFWFETYYFLGFGFYTSALVGVVFLDKPRSDYYEYLLHHLVTLFLIATSWHFRCHRYGLIILLLHDTGDVLLNLAKLLGYCSPWWADGPSTTVFVLFIVDFFIARLVFLPFTIIPSGYWEGSQIPHMVETIPHNAMCGMLCVLQCLHIFWFNIIMKAIFAKLGGGRMKDQREDGEDDDQIISEKKKTK